MLVLTSTMLTEEIRDKLNKTYTEIQFEFFPDINQALGLLHQAEILITYGEDLTPELIQEAENLKWIMVISAGMDLMPFDEIKKKNILVTNAKGIHKIPMAEYAISMFLHLYHNTYTFIENQKKHHWDRDVFVDEITGKTMTIVGTGVIGQELARLAKAFRIKTIGVSRSGEDKQYFDKVYKVDDIEEALPEAEFVVSILPSTKETVGLFQKRHFQIMKESAVFLNMGRGDVVQSETIIEALNHNEIAHAILDVFEQEPLPANHPLWSHKKVTITPHKSSHSPKYIPRAMAIFEENLKKYVKGESNYVNKINVERGY